MKLYKVIGILYTGFANNEYTEDIVEYEIIKETNKNIVCFWDEYRNKKFYTLKNNLDKIIKSYAGGNADDSMIKYYIYTKNEENFDKYKIEIKEEIRNRLIYLKNKAEEKIKIINQYF